MAKEDSFKYKEYKNANLCLIDLVGTEEELQNAVEIYQIPCKEILNSLGEISRLRCKPEDLLTAMEVYQSLSQRESSQFEEF